MRGDQLFSSGIMGATSQLQLQTFELKKSLVALSGQPDSKAAKDNFEKALLVAHAVSVITDKELKQCEEWLEDK